MRRKSKWIVCLCEGESLTPVQEGAFPSSNEARRFVKSEGLNGQSFRIFAELGDKITVSVENVEKRTLVETSGGKAEVPS